MDERQYDESEDLRRWVRNWEETAPLLEEIRRREIRELDTHQALRNLEDAFKLRPLAEVKGDPAILATMKRLQTL